MSKFFIDPSEKTAMFQVIAGNTQMCGKQVQLAIEKLNSDESDENKQNLEFAQEQLKDHQAIYACIQTALTMLNPTSLETIAKTIDEHIVRLREELEINQDLDFHAKLEYNILAWEKIKMLLQILSVDIPDDFMVQWKQIKV